VAASGGSLGVCELLPCSQGQERSSRNACLPATTLRITCPCLISSEGRWVVSEIHGLGSCPMERSLRLGRWWMHTTHCSGLLCSLSLPGPCLSTSANYNRIRGCRVSSHNSDLGYVASSPRADLHQMILRSMQICCQSGLAPKKEHVCIHIHQKTFLFRHYNRSLAKSAGKDSVMVQLGN
jgi:hypothetical protein